MWLLLLKNYQAVIGGVLAIGLSIALFTTRHTLATRTDERDLARSNLANEQVAHAITRTSLNTCTGIVDAKNAETEARAKALADSKADDAKAVADADARQKADAGRLATLRALVRDLPANPACRVPAALSAQLEGL